MVARYQINTAVAVTLGKSKRKLWKTKQKASGGRTEEERGPNQSV